MLTRVITAEARRPLVGVLCCNRVVDSRRSQIVSNRFIEPLVDFAGVSVLVIPSMVRAVDAGAVAAALDGLLMTGSCSNVETWRYDGGDLPRGQEVDPERDEVAFRMAEAMMGRGKPVFGICRGLQELNVLFGGSLDPHVGDGVVRHHSGLPRDADLDELFAHEHEVDLKPGGMLSPSGGRIVVNSVHRQGIARLGGGLEVEATAPDGLVEAFSAKVGNSDVLAVQWHSEWPSMPAAGGRAFFEAFGRAAA